MSDDVADLGDGNDGDFVDRDLGDLAQPVAGGRLDFEPELIGVVAQHARQRADHGGGQFGEEIALHDQRRTRLSVIARRRDDDELAAPHYDSGHS